MTESQTITPFWQHLPQVLRYPLRGENLIVISLLAVLGWAGQVFVLIAIAAWLFTFSYGYGVLAHTARGNLQPRAGYFDLISIAVVWKQLALWFVFAVAVMASYRWLGWVGAIAVGLAVFVALPIATMSLAFDQDLAAALNPVTWREAMRRIGGRYIHLLGVLAASLVVGWCAGWAAGLVPVVGGLGTEWVSRYVLVAQFYLLGYVIYQYHQELEMDIDPVALIIARRADEPPPDPALTRCNLLIEAGDPVGARQVLRAALDHQGALSPLAEPYRQLCASMGDEEAELALFADQLAILLPDDRYEEATGVLRLAVDLNPDIVLRNPEDILGFAKALLTEGHSELALALAQRFDDKYPGHRDRIGNGFLAARILSDRLGRDGEALLILRQLEQAFADHPQIDEVRAYRDEVTRRIAP